MPFAMEKCQISFSLLQFLAASNCGCDAVVHSRRDEGTFRAKLEASLIESGVSSMLLADVPFDPPEHHILPNTLLIACDSGGNLGGEEAHEGAGSSLLHRSLNFRIQV